jgi:hypothetical protein
MKTKAEKSSISPNTQRRKAPMRTAVAGALLTLAGLGAGIANRTETVAGEAVANPTAVAVAEAKREALESYEKSKTYIEGPSRNNTLEATVDEITQRMIVGAKEHPERVAFMEGFAGLRDVGLLETKVVKGNKTYEVEVVVDRNNEGYALDSSHKELRTGVSEPVPGKPDKLRYEAAVYYRTESNLNGAWTTTHGHGEIDLTRLDGAGPAANEQVEVSGPDSLDPHAYNNSPASELQAREARSQQDMQRLLREAGL